MAGRVECRIPAVSHCDSGRESGGGAQVGRTRRHASAACAERDAACMIGDAIHSRRAPPPGGRSARRRLARLPRMRRLPHQTGSPAATRRVVRATSCADSVFELPPFRRRRRAEMRRKESLQNVVTKLRDKNTPPKIATAFASKIATTETSWRFFVTQFCREV